jgi:flagellar hook-basal body complex protein FliE
MSNPIGGVSSAVASMGMDTGAKQIPVLQDKASGGTSFGDTLKGLVNNVSDQQDAAADYAQRFARGEPVELHQVMASAEEASISLEMLVQVRNKFQDAYRSLISMQS